jgi:hypothetical protein
MSRLAARMALLTAGLALAAASGVAVAAEKSPARKIPLERCDQLSGKAQTECLEKARLQVLEARRARMASPELAEGKGKAAKTEP